MCGTETVVGYSYHSGTQTHPDTRTSEQLMVDMLREDLGIAIEPQALRMFLRHRWSRLAPLGHRIHEGKR